MLQIKSLEQMKLATSVKYVFSQREGIVEVTSPNKSVYFVKPSDDITCTCTFYKTMFMPCRHIFAARRLLQLPLFQLSMVPQRWIKQYQLSIEEESHVQSNSQAPDVKISSFTRKALATCTLSRSQKYNKMMSLCQKLATAASLCGMPDFRKKYEDIENIVQHWEQNGDYTVTRQIMDVSNGPGYDQGSCPAFSGDITTLECVSTANGPRNEPSSRPAFSGDITTLECVSIANGPRIEPSSRPAFSGDITTLECVSTANGPRNEPSSRPAFSGDITTLECVSIANGPRNEPSSRPAFNGDITTLECVSIANGPRIEPSSRPAFSGDITTLECVSIANGPRNEPSSRPAFNGDITTLECVSIANGPRIEPSSRPAFSGDITTLECVSTANGPRNEPSSRPAFSGDITTLECVSIANGPRIEPSSRPAFSGDITTLECVSTANGPRNEPSSRPAFSGDITTLECVSIANGPRNEPSSRPAFSGDTTTLECVSIANGPRIESSSHPAFSGDTTTLECVSTANGPGNEPSLHPTCNNHSSANTCQSTNHGLSLSMLATSMKVKPRIKTRGRPKHSGTVWCKKRKVMNSENIPPTKRVKSSTEDNTLGRHPPIENKTTSNRKRTRCGKCSGCKHPNCGTCPECLDMKQFGGQGRKKKACSMRKCSAQSVETMTSAVHGTDISQKDNKKLLEKPVGTTKLSLAPESSSLASLVSESKPPSSILTNITDFLKDHNRKVHTVAADGNCMYRALSHQLCGSEENHFYLRSLLLQVVKGNSDIYSKYWIEDMPWGIVSFDQHVEDIGKPGSWGTQVELQACSDFINLDVYVCSHNAYGIVRWEKKAIPKNWMNQIPHNLFTPTRCRHIELSFSNSHYNSVVPTQDEVPPPTILEQHCDAVVID
ncbi:uncharacterized protein [Dysidea avara]|uniref:uncharacterized protein isoform X7 n=1 Tax=Dysidea avara TaxID=196820 RepID=UPI003325CA19